MKLLRKTNERMMTPFSNYTIECKDESVLDLFETPIDSKGIKYKKGKCVISVSFKKTLSKKDLDLLNNRKYVIAYYRVVEIEESNTIINEERHLIKLTVYKTNNTFSFNYQGGAKVFRGDDDQLALLLRRIKASDNKELPRSARFETYKQMAEDIVKGSDITIWVWSNIWGKLPTIFKLETINKIKEL